MTSPVVLVADSADALAAATATRAVEVLSAAVEANGEAHLAVTGGSILEQVLAALATTGPLDWERVQVWWGDERFVASDDADRNDLPAIAKLFEHVPAVLHRMPASDGAYGDDVDAAARGYADELARAAGTDLLAFDLVLLGVGPDGHCCSLFPGEPGPRDHESTVIGVRNSPKPPPVRISLGFHGLNAARRVWVIASGEGKAHAAAMALGGADPARVPSAGARGQDETLWLLDTDAAGELPDSQSRTAL